MSLAPSPAIDSRSFDYLAALVLKESAIVIEKTKTYLFESRLMPIARSHNLSDLDQLVEALKRPGSTALVDSVIDAMTTNETSFFRDLHPFNALRTHLIPELIQKRSKERVLNVWSNACSSGQEVYSIAMLLKENFPELAGWRVRLTATDLSKQILDKAQSGIFTQTEINRGLPMPMVLKYFKRNGVTWQISDEIRKMVDFRVLNLVQPWPPSLPKMDIVFLRNVLIYFSVDTKKEILWKVHRNLQKDGVLLLGGAETTMNLDVPFERRVIDKTTGYFPI
ncbi:CheR family methyltransferase [Rhodopirellula europaea]|uniref:protein-glutamate O-methyltransferase n=1 Tax=Rhodopirellula europaea 6C TaxID=1263867 RepID=M2B048_9BACT|nr:protein-glutamate O-methyltransferase CheR [Rhodopirellula europaea]EMB15163.1 chemotaxis protein methyltransferase CheR [Rhodopirellula europaea 6C]